MAQIDFKQYDPPWNLDPYANENVWVAGCGGVSPTDLIASMIPNITPREVCAWLENNGWTYPNSGTLWEGIPAVIRHYGYECTQLCYSSMLHMYNSKVFDTFFESIRNGHQGIMLLGNGGSPVKWCNSGHYIAIVDYKDGQYLVSDPASETRVGWHPISDFIPSIKILYTTNIPTSGEPTGYAYSFTSASLHKGSKGNLVKLFQTVWSAIGVHKDKIDGDYGEKTEASCRKWQQTHRLADDGWCGLDTQTSTLGLVHRGYTFYLKKVQKGEKGESAKLLQCFLKVKGFYDGAIDGDFGIVSDEALVKFQTANGLKPDRQCAKETWKKVLEV